jgi:hypothetical protein
VSGEEGPAPLPPRAPLPLSQVALTALHKHAWIPTTVSEPLAFFTVGAFCTAGWVCKVLQVILPIRTNADKRKTI